MTISLLGIERATFEWLTVLSSLPLIYMLIVLAFVSRTAAMCTHLPVTISPLEFTEVSGFPQKNDSFVPRAATT